MDLTSFLKMNRTVELDVSCPSLSLIRFAVYDNFDKGKFEHSNVIRGI